MNKQYTSPVFMLNGYVQEDIVSTSGDEPVTYNNDNEKEMGSY